MPTLWYSRRRQFASLSMPAHWSHATQHALDAFASRLIVSLCFDTTVFGYILRATLFLRIESICVLFGISLFDGPALIVSSESFGQHTKSIISHFNSYSMPFWLRFVCQPCEATKPCIRVDCCHGKSNTCRNMADGKEIHTHLWPTNSPRNGGCIHRNWQWVAHI